MIVPQTNSHVFNIPKLIKVHLNELLIRRTFSLIDLITNIKISNCPNILKLTLFGSKVNIMYYTSKYVSKQLIVYKVVKTCIFYLHLSCFVFKDKDYCPIEIIKGLTDKGQFQYLTKL